MFVYCNIELNYIAFFYVIDEPEGKFLYSNRQSCCIVLYCIVLYCIVLYCRSYRFLEAG